MRSRTNKRPLMIGGAAVAGAIALTFAGTAAASAHVTIAEGSAEAGAYTILTFGVPHGCGDAPTTQVAIQIPDGINSVTPTRNSFYSVEKVTETLDTPIVDGHGNEVTERVAEVVYTTTAPLPADQRDAFELSLQIPADAAGQTLYFPTVQTCTEGETAWVQIPADGQDPHELAEPSPAIVITAAAADSHSHGDADETSHTVGESAEGSTHAAEPVADQTPLIVTSLAVGGLGLIVGMIALLRGRKTT